MIITNAKQAHKTFVHWTDKLYKQSIAERKEVEKVLNNFGEKVKARIIRHMTQDPKTGHIYYLPGGKLHQASAPWESPAKMTGNLISALNYEVENNKLTIGALRMGSSDIVDYAKYLEQGTTKMAPRPYLESTTREVGKGFDIKLNILKSAFDLRMTRDVGWYT